MQQAVLLGSNAGREELGRVGRGWSAHTLCRGSLWSQELPSDLSGRKEGGLLAQGKDTSVPGPSQELRGRTGSPELLCWAAARRPPHPPPRSPG